ncbi:MAG: glycosyltransferase [Sphingomonadaceae bacterium]|nr:glycosyltransferase [Sphingomonadaceae bacterium]
MQNNSQSFSIIFCVNRSSEYLQASIDSILKQTHPSFRFLIGANACSDELLAELQQHVHGDRRVDIFRSDVPQLSYNLNLLLDHATTEWVVRMDADDVSEPDRLERIAHHISLCPDVDVWGSWATVIDENGEKTGDFRPGLTTRAIRRSFPYSNQICHPTVAFRRSFWLEMRGYLGGYVSEDYDLWLRALNRDIQIRNIPEQLLQYRVHKSQVSGSRRGYAEVAGHWLREFMLRPSLFNFNGLLISSLKSIAKIVTGAK